MSLSYSKNTTFVKNCQFISVRMKKLYLLGVAGLLLPLLLFFVPSCDKSQSGGATLEPAVTGDPLGVQIYTLKNGLKVYMSVNKAKPRIQANIAVRVGSKNDPAETTGLSHYLEHLMFKGTPRYGTMNYEAEKPLLDEITNLYEEYRKTKDSAQRVVLYHKIDSVSYAASSYLIANEYDKLMATIGAQGVNAFTSYDQTVYVQDIPSNQIESWCEIQADRFKDMVIRGFHTELEAVYEEKNQTMDDDVTRVIDSLLYALFPNFPYGTQTTIGTQEHLKNPSIVNILNHYKTWYVANNVAICMSGDFDPVETLKIIEKYFGDMPSNPNLPELATPALKPMEKIKESNVYGMQQELTAIAWPMPGAKTDDDYLVAILTELLSNGQAGLLDQEINLKLKALSAQAFRFGMTDYDLLATFVAPLEGQSLEDVRDLILEQVERIRKGDFDESLLKAIVRNREFQQQHDLESNNARVQMMVSSFISRHPWKDEVESINKMRNVTKQQVVDFANKYLTTNAYAICYKRQGENKANVKIAKPAITPIQMNRDTVSDFVRRIQNTIPKPIEPVFADVNKELEHYDLREGVKVLLSKNKVNSLFSVTYRFEFGTKHSRTIEVATEYAQYLSSSAYDIMEFNNKLYELGASYSITSSENLTTIKVEGLSDQMSETLSLVESHLRSLIPDPALYNEYVQATLKARSDKYKDPKTVFNALFEYVHYGAKNPVNTVLSNAELKKQKPEDLVAEIASLFAMPHTVVCFTPSSKEELGNVLNSVHKPAETLVALPSLLHDFKERIPAGESTVYVVNYDGAMQVFLNHYGTNGEHFDAAKAPVRDLYNEYFGGSMNAIVFQEIREARALAYAAYAMYREPRRKENLYYMHSYIGTQSDKLPEAIKAFNEILLNMPESEKAFAIAKNAMIEQLRTRRYDGRTLPNLYFYLRNMGLEQDPDAEVYAQVPSMKLSDVVAFQKSTIKNLVYDYAMLGDMKYVDRPTLEKLGKIVEVKISDLFGF